MLICIDAGHYMGTPGKRCLKSIDPAETREWVLNSRVADKVQSRLKEYDCQTMRVDDTTGQKEVTLYQRVTQANNANADIYLSIHHNAGVNGGPGGGIMVYTAPNCQAKSKELQKAIYDATVASTGLKGNRSTPLATANFYVLTKTTMPAVLGEFGFMDSTTDVPIILTEEYADNLADGIVAGLVDCLSLAKTTVSSGPSVTVACDVGDFAIEMVNATKNANGTNYANAGYFGVYSENGTNFTLPSAHLVCDYKADNTYVRKYCEERGSFDGDKFAFDSGSWSYNNPLYGKKVTTLYIQDGQVYVDELDHAPQADYAISGIPIIRNGSAVDYTSVKDQGWDDSSCRATWHTVLGVKDNTIYIMGWESTSANAVKDGSAARVFAGYDDVIKLDGGGSYYLDKNGDVSTSGGDRLINNIIRFVPKEEDAMYDQWKAYMERWLKELAEKPASDWAKPYIQEAIDAGLMTDVGGTIERPQAYVTRQELATVAAAIKK